MVCRYVLIMETRRDLFEFMQRIEGGDNSSKIYSKKLQ